MIICTSFWNSVSSIRTLETATKLQEVTTTQNNLYTGLADHQQRARSQKAINSFHSWSWRGRNRHPHRSTFKKCKFMMISITEMARTPAINNDFWTPTINNDFWAVSKMRPNCKISINSASSWKNIGATIFCPTSSAVLDVAQFYSPFCCSCGDKYLNTNSTFFLQRSGYVTKIDEDWWWSHGFGMWASQFRNHPHSQNLQLKKNCDFSIFWWQLCSWPPQQVINQ